jgi:hypothetical protein
MTGRPREAPDDIREKQDPGFSKRAFGSALDRVTKRLADPSEPDLGSSKK